VSADVPETPSVAAIRDARRELGDRVRTTPVWRWEGDRLAGLLAPATEVTLKLELFQHAGTFKPRGALLNMLGLDPEVRARGVTAVSAGNHAIAVAFAAGRLGCSAKVVMTASANPARVERCRAYGGEIVPAPDVHSAFDIVRAIERDEGRAFIHPFEGERTILGTATVGLELAEQAPELEAVVVPVGGGGLCAGVATAIKQLLPECAVYGVEPVGADSMHRSFAAGEPRAIERVATIADSLGAPHAAPYGFALCRRFVDELVRVDDDDLRRAMRLLFEDAKLVAEPAAAASTAALLGPLRDKLAGRRVGLVICGSNIDPATFHSDLAGTGPTS
jgi:threonine dehydratase